MTIIRQFFKTLYHKIRNDRLRTGLLQVLPFWVASLITGLVAVVYSRLFAWAENSTHRVLEFGSWLIFLLVPAAFLLSWWIVNRFAPYAGGSGIPQVMASIDMINTGAAHRVKKLLGIRIIIVKILSSLVMIFGGGAIGREGPTIQISGSIFAKIHSWLPAWWPKISRANMIISGAAAGLAAAFNTPLGGIVFAVEELARTHIRFFRTAIFTAVIIAGLTAQGFLGPYLYLGYPQVSGTNLSVFFVVLLVSVVGGFAGASMGKLIVAIVNWRKSLRHTWQNVVVITFCALVIATIAYFINDVVLGSGKRLMTETLFTDEKFVPAESALFRILGPILSFTTGASGGIFAPSLSAGAGIGSFFSGWLDLSVADTNLVILAGMVGFLTGVTRSPFTSAILVLEMTDRHNVVFHLMFAAMISHLAAFLVSRHSLYDRLKKIYVRNLHQEDQVEDESPPASTDKGGNDPAGDRRI